MHQIFHGIATGPVRDTKVEVSVIKGHEMTTDSCPKNAKFPENAKIGHDSDANRVLTVHSKKKRPRKPLLMYYFISLYSGYEGIAPFRCTLMALKRFAKSRHSLITGRGQSAKLSFPTPDDLSFHRNEPMNPSPAPVVSIALTAGLTDETHPEEV